jgi:hypothetical protein
VIDRVGLLSTLVGISRAERTSYLIGIPVIVLALLLVLIARKNPGWRLAMKSSPTAVGANAVSGLFAAGVAIVSLAALGGGGFWLYHHYHHDRSVSAYCNVFYGQGEALRSEYQGIGAQSDPIDDLGAIFSAPSQLANFLGQLANVAPMTIEPDVVIIQQAFAKEATQLTSNPIAALVDGLGDGAASNDAVNQVNQWTLQNCGAPPGSGASNTSG